MAPFFSYKTFSSVNAVTGELIKIPPVFVSQLLHPHLHKGAETSDGLAYDQVLHLIGAFVGVERFGVREKTSSLIVSDDAVASENFSGPRDRLATLGCAERLGQRRMSVA